MLIFLEFSSLGHFGTDKMIRAGAQVCVLYLTMYLSWCVRHSSNQTLTHLRNFSISPPHVLKPPRGRSTCKLCKTHYIHSEAKEKERDTAVNHLKQIERIQRMLHTRYHREMSKTARWKEGENCRSTSWRALVCENKKWTKSLNGVIGRSPHLYEAQWRGDSLAKRGIKASVTNAHTLTHAQAHTNTCAHFTKNLTHTHVLTHLRRTNPRWLFF